MLWNLSIERRVVHPLQHLNNDFPVSQPKTNTFFLPPLFLCMSCYPVFGEGGGTVIGLPPEMHAILVVMEKQSLPGCCAAFPLQPAWLCHVPVLTSVFSHVHSPANGNETDHLHVNSCASPLTWSLEFASLP